MISWIFLRVLGLIYFAAFSSLAVQIAGLVGSDGILPLGEYLERAYRTLGEAAYWQLPTVFWFDASDLALRIVCLAGMASAVLLVFDRFTRASLFGCYALYLSLVYAGQLFMSFQWDLFLLESGFLAFFLTGGSIIAIWLYRWLLFRFMLMGGVVKLASGDPSWWSLTALHYHFETQPLPSPLAWYAHQIPMPLLEAGTAAVFVIELLVPFFALMSRRLRLVAAASFLVLQGAIMLTGSYNFFNILTIALCLFLLEDRDLRPWLGVKVSQRVELSAPRAGDLTNGIAMAMALISVSACGTLLWWTNTHQRPVQPFLGLVQVTSTLGIVNGYGPFAVMTTNRDEIVVEGSDDGEDWREYEFRYKPGDPGKPLQWNIPHQPRLDWQLWFAALGDAPTTLWFLQFMEKLRAGSKPVLSLLAKNPFAGHPPKYVRAIRYRYRFSTPELRKKTGQVWQREPLGLYQTAMP